jgi:biotin carboxylase
MTSLARVLIVGCGFPQLGLLRAAHGLGLEVIGVDANPRAIGAAVCHDFREVSTNDVDRIAALARELRADGITTCGSEIALASTARAAEVLGLPFYGDVATVDRCQDKDQMRNAYRRGGAPIPAFTVVTSLAEAESFVHAEGLPVVIKPSRGWGQRGVSKVEKESELAPAFERARAASSAGIAVVEAFIEGREFSVNAYTAKGTTAVYSVTERIITHYPDPPGITFAEWFPAGLDGDDQARAVEAALAGVRALGIQRGPTYTQLRIGPCGAMIVETAYRLGGGLDPDVALLASGTSLFRKILGVALRRDDWESAGPEGEPHGGAIGKFLVGRPGRVVGIHGLEAARSMPGVMAAEVYVEPGGTVYPLTDGSKRAGHVLAVGADRDEANARAESAAQTIRIETV